MEKNSKKNSLLPGILGIVAVIAIIGALLFPLGPGLIAKDSFAEAAKGYDFVFGNEALQLNDPYGAMIAWFVLLLIAAFFGVVAAITGFFGGKVGAFFSFLTGVICLVCAVLFFLSPIMVGNVWASSFNTSASLGWGYIIAGACSGVGALASLVIGVKGLFGKAA